MLEFFNRSLSLILMNQLQINQAALRVFDEVEETSNSGSQYWLGEERLSAVKDVIECNDHTSSVIGHLLAYSLFAE